MKVVAVCGSPRKGGNTEQACEIVLKGIALNNIETELITLVGLEIGPCTACGGCAAAHKCVAHKDDFQPIYEKIVAADGLVLASPVYFSYATGPICNLIHRLGYVARRCGNPLSRKVGTAIAVARRAGHNATFQQLTMFFPIMDMVTVGSSYWNVIQARDPGDIAHDEEGLKTLERLSENFAWLLNKIN